MPRKKHESTATEKALKLLYLLLFTGRAYSLGDLAETLECSRQTVLRLIDQLEAIPGAKFQRRTENRQSYYQIQVLCDRPKVSLTDTELSQLVLCREWMCHLLPEGMRANLEKTAEKAAVLLDDYETRSHALTPLGQGVAKGRIDYSAFEKILERLMVAIRERQVVEAVYLSPHRDAPKAHVFVPVRVMAFHEALYVRGWTVAERGVPEVQREITLAIHRLQRLQPTRRIVPEGALRVLPPVDENGHFGMSRQTAPFEVSAKFRSGGAKYVRERKWSACDRLEEASDGTVVLTFHAQSELEVVKWILSFGREAELLSPAHLRERVREELTDALGYYSLREAQSEVS